MLVLFAASVLCANFIQVDPKSQFFVDAQNRSRFFHGVNAVYKIAPWHPDVSNYDAQSSLTAQDMDNLQAWGFTAVRLGVMWPGVEWNKGQYNSTYLSIMLGIIRGLMDRGIYTIVDCHQDVYNRKFCGEGVPDWAVTTYHDLLPFPMPIAASIPTNSTTGYPVLSECLKRQFAEYYVTDAVAANFQSLYDNHNGLQDSFAGFWKAVATAFKDEPGVLGYELINEPFAGDVFRDPALIIDSGRADLHNLQPMYTKLHNAIRTIDTEHIIFFEAAVSNYGRTGFTQGPGGPAYNNRQAYSYHIYCGTKNRTGDPSNIPKCDAEDMLFFENKMADLKKLGTGGFMTEFGAMLESPTASTNLMFLTDAAEQRFQSWTYWQYKAYQDLTTQSDYGESFYYPNGTLQQTKVRMLSRTYARAVAGAPVVTSFDASAADAPYTLRYTVGATHGNATTEIYVNQPWYYPRGFTVTIDPPNGASWAMVGSTIVSVQNKLPVGSTLSVSIRGK